MTFTHPKDAPEGHKWQLRNGQKARIYCTDAGGAYPIHGAVETSEGRWSCRMWTSDGKFARVGNSQNDLIDAPRTHKVWVNVYQNVRTGEIIPSAFSADYIAREDADTIAREWIILARTCIEIAEGEGLE